MGIFGIVFEFAEEAFGDGDDGSGHCDRLGIWRVRGVCFGFEAFGYWWCFEA